MKPARPKSKTSFSRLKRRVAAGGVLLAVFWAILDSMKRGMNLTGQILCRLRGQPGPNGSGIRPFFPDSEKDAGNKNERATSGEQ